MSQTKVSQDSCESCPPNSNVPQCQQTAKTVVDTIIALAEESSDGSNVSLVALRRIGGAVSNLAELYHSIYRRCEAAHTQQSAAPLRTHIMGRIISQSLEPLLFARPPVIERVTLVPLFRSFRTLIGEETFDEFEERASAVYLEFVGEHGAELQWDHFYADPRVIALYPEIMTPISREFSSNYEDTKRWFITDLKKRFKRLEPKQSFSQNDYFRLFTALLRPVHPRAQTSLPRIHMEKHLLKYSVELIDKFCEEFSQDKKKYRVEF